MNTRPHIPPTVSVVIPTHRRPKAALLAVHSVMAQTLRNLEVVVVVDGPDPRTVGHLESITDPRLRIVVLECHQGVEIARDTGIAHARAPWVALLDDDDTWMPEKLEKQLQAVRSTPHRWPIVTCRFIRRSAGGDLLLPRRLPRPGEPVGDYLLGRYRLRWGDGVMQASTLFAARELFQRIPFQQACTDHGHEDLEWVIRAAGQARTGIVFADDPRPLSIWTFYGDRPSISRSTRWRRSLKWAGCMRREHLIGNWAYASFVLTWCSMFAARTGEWHAAGPLLKSAWKLGSPRLIDLVVFLANWRNLRRPRSPAHRDAAHHP